MAREKSQHKVTILKLDAWQKRVTAMMLERGKIDEYTTMKAGLTPFGIIEKDGKHYLIDHDGVGSFEPCDETQDYIEWFEFRKKEGDEYETFNIVATARTNFLYHELVSEKILTKKRVRLDTFIRQGGSRLEGNYARTDLFLSGKIDKYGKRIKQELKTA
jgi:hypothetical protein